MLNNLIDFIYKYVRCNVYFGRRLKKIINKIYKVMYVYFLLFIFCIDVILVEYVI